MRNKGYTFAEMLVVLAIIALMMAIVVPRIAFQQKGAGLKGAAKQVMSTLRTARRLAIKDINMYAVAFDLYSVPSRFGILKSTGADFNDWILVGEFERLPENIAIVSITAPSYTTFDVTRTDDLNLNGVEDSISTSSIYNPQIVPPGFPEAGQPGSNGLTNQVFRLVKFQPTGTADPAIIYLWNTTESRQELPNPSKGHTLSNLHVPGVPPGLQINDMNDQQNFFRLPDEASASDSYYYTLVVNNITGGVIIYDYAWGEGGGTSPNMRWDRKKDGE